ncbi:sacsin N-terminal ATP-binding-like domain-containing protein [Actinokineospora sp.]|uniref:sacsin N-terminal ATP-binding-like domain-containing protein n=1 Tax=Actinokineospora sp. TaxID=1872133 RepID=UPI003D6C4B98
MSGLDPFDTAALRAAVLSAWTASPTRFREDANAEEDLYLGGYRDRLLVELAQNAADAAEGSGILRVSLVDNELRAANTGRPLDAAGVAALASLRASAKAGGVGQFGVGFAAVLAVTDAPRVVSVDGGVAFSADDTRAAVGEVATLAARVAERAGRVPVLRLVWPVDETPPSGFATEVRLPLRADVDGAALLAGFAEQAVDLLLALPGLHRIEIDDAVWERAEEPIAEAAALEEPAGWEQADEPIPASLDDPTSAITQPGEGARVEIRGPEGVSAWLVYRVEGALGQDIADTLGVEARPHWTACWAVPVDTKGIPRPQAVDVLHAPTPTDDRLSLPARLVATLPIEPTRRRVRPGAAADAVLAEAAKAYPSLVRLVADEWRTSLVPQAGFPLSEVDDRLRDMLLAELRQAEWLPAKGKHRSPARSKVLDVEAEGLAELLSDVLPDLLDGSLSAQRHTASLAALDVPRIRLAELVELITGITRPPTWWRKLYAALAPIVDTDPGARAELGGLPVPLADGRTLPGPRGTVLLDGAADLLDLLAHTEVGALRVVHADAAHPVLEKLGAHVGVPIDVLDGLQETVESSLDDAESGVDTSGLVSVVLRLVRDSGVRAGDKPWLGALALPDSVGDWRRADELALPGSPLLDVLDEDSPVGVLSADLAAEWAESVLIALGVLDAFALVVDENPTGPDHDLADEADWWDASPDPPSRVIAVRDLDLVTEDAWPRALALLASEPDTWRALHEAGGYTGWWISRHAVIGGSAPGEWRMPEARELAGLYDEVPDIGVDPRVLAAIGVRTELTIENADDAEELLGRLGDLDRAVNPGTVLRAHAALAEAVVDEVIEPADVRPPAGVRTLAGTVKDECSVLDAPWLLAVVGEDSVISAGPDFALAEALADLLDLPLASEEVAGEPAPAGEFVPWADLGAVAAACDLLGVDVPEGGAMVHDKLVIQCADGDHPAPWWVHDGIAHCEDTPQALARALAWTTDRWLDRHTLAELIEDPANHLI